jgi:hypothetical protein
MKRCGFLLYQFGNLVVLDGGRRRAKRSILVVEIGLRRSGQHLHIDAHRIHVTQAMREIEAATRKRAIDYTTDVERC